MCGVEERATKQSTVRSSLHRARLLRRCISSHNNDRMMCSTDRGLSRRPGPGSRFAAAVTVTPANTPTPGCPRRARPPWSIQPNSLQDLLAVGHPPIHLLRRLAGQQQRGARHARSAARLCGSSMPLTSLWYTVPGVGTTRDGDTAATVMPSYCAISCARPWVNRSSAALRRAVHHAAAHRLVGIRPAPGPDRRAGADVDDRARCAAGSCPSALPSPA